MGSRCGAGPDPSLVEKVNGIVCDDWERLVRIACDHGLPDYGEDSVHDAYVKVRSGEVRPEDPDGELLLWFRRVVRNVARNRRRREAARAHESLEAVENHPADGHDGVDWDWLLYRRLGLRRALEQELRVLTDSELEVAEARLLEGRRHREIAEARGSSVSTVRNLWRRAKAKLEAGLKQWSHP